MGAMVLVLWLFTNGVVAGYGSWLVVEANVCDNQNQMITASLESDCQKEVK